MSILASCPIHTAFQQNYLIAFTLVIKQIELIDRTFGYKAIESLITEDEEFVAAAYEQGRSRSGREAKALVNEVSGLFAGGKLSEDDMDAAMRAIQNAYWIAKEESKRKYTQKIP